ncbi:helix-turn-helix transcriptional regulator [Rhodococcus sp. D2-41]|uniref:TetR/AcrR family transcriptional regulator n=1 Tax=Speluncibacter jeojiensis TaxID=2710754 RepID=UPI00241057F4|nr:TetR/AcrR family transcriptional regulator [Rhodococcus sp. D2-41]MDG3009895.1 helix-turn-helix transcriptional regulator [Rhodococcus sp. D2-41]
MTGRAVRAADDSVADTSDDVVFDAALAVLARRGPRDATMEEIAAESGVSRATLFRRYGGKDRVFELALVRDMRRFLEETALRYETTIDPAEQVAETFVACIAWRDHVLLRGAEPARVAEFVASLGTGSPSPLELAHGFVAAHLRAYQVDWRLPAADADLQADMLIHLVLGYLASPRPVLDLDDPAALHAAARTLLAPILLHPNTDG